MHCWVNKGAKGIALIDDDTNTGLKYVFDISDVHKARRIGRFPDIWDMQEEHKDAILDRLERTIERNTCTSADHGGSFLRRINPCK